MTDFTSYFQRKRRRAAHAPSRLVGVCRQAAILGFSYLAGLADVGSVVAAAYLSNKLLRVASLGLLPSVESVTSVGVFVAALVALFALQRGEYDLRFYPTRTGQFTRTFPAWNLAFLVALALGFATKTTAVFSREGVGVFYLFGFICLVLARYAIVDLAAALRRSRLVPPRRVVIVGF